MYSYSDNQNLAINSKDFTIFSIFLAIVCFVFISIHVFIMYFYSSDYRKYKCNDSIAQIKKSGIYEIKTKILDVLRKSFVPEKRVYFSITEELMRATIDASYKSSDFSILDTQSDGRFATVKHKYLVNFKIKNLGFCQKHLDDRTEEVEINIYQVPLSQWLIYNSSEAPLRFSSEYNTKLAGRVFSKKDIVLNYRNEKKKKETLYAIDSYKSDPYTFFTNYDEAKKWVDNGLATKGIIKAKLYEKNNNTIYVKNKTDLISYSSIYDLKPFRIISDIALPIHTRENSRFLKINLPDEGIYTSYEGIDYFDWFNTILKSIDGKEKYQLGQFIQYNLAHLELGRNSVKLFNSSDLENFEEKAFKGREGFFSVSQNNVRLNMKKFFSWYSSQFRMRIPIMERDLHSEKSFLCLITLSEELQQKLEGGEIELHNLEEVPFRSFFIFNSPLVLTSSVNIDSSVLAIMAEDFLISNSKNEKEFFINSVLIKRRADHTINEFFGLKSDFTDIRVSFKGSIIFLNNLPGGEKREGLNNINFSWDNRFFEENYWIRFLPSKFYLIE